jgi:ATP-binding protein involved in chromosome partitioning
MYQDKEPKRRFKYVLAVAAGKGGVGKSTCSVGLALALRQLGFRVGLLDTDVYGPSIRQMLPEDRLPGQKDDRFIPALSGGVEIMSMAYFRREGEAAMVRAPVANGVIQQFLHKVEWSPLDYLIIDFPPGTGDVQLTLAQQGQIDGAVMVTTPQEVAVLDVRKAMHLFETVKVPILGVLENMSYFLHEDSGQKLHLLGQGGGQRLAQEKGVPLLGEMPLSPALAMSCDQGKPLQLAEPEHPVSVAFLDLARTVDQQLKLMQTQEQEGVGEFEMQWETSQP